jgi:hypothetical protein
MGFSLSVSPSECGSSAACKKLGPQFPLIGGNQTVQTHAKNYPHEFHISFRGQSLQTLWTGQIYHNEALPCPVKPSGSDNILRVWHSTDLQAERK